MNVEKSERMHFKNLIKAIEENNYELKQEAILGLTETPNELALELLKQLITSDKEDLTIKVKASKAIVATTSSIERRACYDENRGTALFKLSSDHSDFFKKLNINA